MLKTVDLVKKYGEKTLDYSNINMEILRGEKIALVGPVGVGKSTLLKMVAGIIEPVLVVSQLEIRLILDTTLKRWKTLIPVELYLKNYVQLLDLSLIKDCVLSWELSFFLEMMSLSQLVS